MIILDWKVSQYPGPRRATFSLQLPSGIVIKDCALVYKTDGTRFIGLPQRSYEKDGEKKYIDVVQIPDKATREKFNVQVLDALMRAEHIA